MRLAYGRIFDQGEVQGRRRVAVLGSDIPEDLGGVPPALLVGRTIQIRGRPFEVIGILEEKGSSTPWLRPDSRVYVPLSTAQYRLFGGRDRLNGIAVQVPDAALMDKVYAEIDRILRRQHRIRPGEEVDFQIRNATDLLNTFQEANKTFTYLLAGIAAVSLLVGGIGIMNIMLVSVTERTREIGVRKAMGATRRNILLQFLVESLTPSSRFAGERPTLTELAAVVEAMRPLVDEIIAVVRRTTPFYEDKEARPGLFKKYTYVITSLDRLHNESATSVPCVSEFAVTVMWYLLLLCVGKV